MKTRSGGIAATGHSRADGEGRLITALRNSEDMQMTRRLDAFRESAMLSVMARGR